MPTNVTCAPPVCFAAQACDTIDFPPIQFLGSEGVGYELRNYTFPVSDIMCVVGVTGGSPDDLGVYLMGSLFLQSFYSVYDLDNKQVGISLAAGSTGNLIVSGGNGFPVWAIVVICIVGVALLGTGAYFVVRHFRNKKNA